MATASSSDTLAVADWDHGTESKSDRYLAARLAAAGADFKSVAVATFVLWAAVAATAWLALGVLAEHWLVPGGLPVAVRWAWLVAGVVALGAAVIRWAVPLVRYRVNLVYAARAIEQEHPELHNDLVNAVLVKAHPEDATPLVVRSLERRAAKRLSVVPADGVADRVVPLRLAMALAALVGALGVYQLVAPKSLVVSAARLVAPWWGLAAPARVSIAPPRLAWRMPPDDAAGDRPTHALAAAGGRVTIVRGRQLLVETDVDGLRAGEQAMLVVTPLRDDGAADSAAPWNVPLVAGPQPGRLAAVLPDAARGLDHSVELVVTAGDARSERLRVAVVDTPTLLVREVRYDYPPYTGRKPETVAWQGDLRAPEFTKVTITAECNRPLESAWIDPGCAGRDSERKRMRIGQHDLARASGEFPLRMNSDRTGPEFGSYRLGFQLRASAGGSEPAIVEKLEHRVEVIADKAPEVSIEAPEDAVRVPPSAPVAIRVRAEDVDYGLARVGLETRLRGGAERPPEWLLERIHVGPFSGVLEIVPEQAGAVAGTVLEYRAIAVDTRPDKPNVAHSPWRSLQIDDAAPPRPLDRQPPPGAGAEGTGKPEGGGPPGDGSPAGEGATTDDAGARDRAGEQGGREGSARRDEGTTGEDQQRRRRDNGAPQQSGEQQEQNGQQGGKQGGREGGQQEGQQGGQQGGGEPTAGQAGGGEGSGSKSEPSGSGAGGKQRGEGAGESGRGDSSGETARGEAGRGESGGGETEGGKADGGKADGGKADGGKTADRASGDGKGGAEGTAEGRAPASRQDGAGKEGPGDAGSSDDAGRDGVGRQPADARSPDKGGQRGGAQADGRGNGRSPPRNAVAADGTNDGEAMERILESRRRQESERGEGRSEDTAGGKTPRGDDAAKEGGERQSTPTCPGADGMPCGKEGCEACKGGGASGAGAGQGQAGQGKAGQGQAGQGQAGQGQAGQGQAGQGQAGQGQAGQGQAGQGQAGQGQAGQGQAGQGQAGQGQAGQGQAGQGQAGQGAGREGESESGQAAGRAGDRQPGEGQAGAATEGTPDGPGSKPGGDLPEGAQPAPGSQVGAGGRAGGDRGGAPAGSDGAVPPRREAQWTEQDTAHARNAADLAVKHLGDDLAAGRTDVLDALGWTPEQARAFIDRWQAMRRLAGSTDARERGEFEHAVRSLGLRPDGVRSTRDVPADVRGGQAEGRRSRPPAAYREQVEAYLRGAGGG